MKSNFILCSLGFLLLWPGTVLWAQSGEKATKKINREFSIQSDGRLLIDNKYGAIDVAIGPSGQIRMDVEITAEASSEAKAREILDRISIDFAEGANRVEAMTRIATGSSWKSWGNSDNNRMKIDYKVLVPADVYLELANKYGSIFVASTNRDAQIRLSYGDLRFGESAATLRLDMAYSKGHVQRIDEGQVTLSYSNLDMEHVQNLDMEMKYSELALGNVQRLNLVSAYGELTAGEIGEIRYTGKYDDITLERVRTIHAESGYVGLSIQRLDERGRFDMKYGDLRIDQIARGFSELTLQTGYTGVNLGFDPGTSFALDVQNNYCDVRHSDLTITEQIRKTGSLILQGKRGSGGGRIVARMQYGELKIQ